MRRWRGGATAGSAPPGKTVLDLAVALGLGGDCLADVAVLRAQPTLFNHPLRCTTSACSRSRGCALGVLGKLTDTEQDGADEGFGKAAAVAAGLFTTFVTTVTVFAGATGDLERMFRNKTLLTILALGLTASGGICALGVPGLRPGSSERSRRWRSRCYAAAMTLFIAGLMVGASAALASTREKQRPQVTANLQRNLLTGTISSRGLRSGEVVHVRVLGYGLANTSESVYVSDTGAGDDGHFSLALSRQIPFGKYQTIVVNAWVGNESVDCNALSGQVAHSLGQQVAPNNSETQRVTGERTGCLLLHVPVVPDRPVLSVTWSGKLTARVLNTHVLAKGIATASVVRLRVTARMGRRTITFWDGSAAPNSLGEASLGNAVYLAGTKVRNVCVAADYASPGTAPACSGRRATWARIAVPAAWSR